MNDKTHEIVLLGGNFGGIGATHYLLRHVIPALEQLDKTRAFHVTLVTPNTRFFFKPASPRSSIQPKLLAESKLWRPLSDALGQYPVSQLKLVQGYVVGIDASVRTVTVASTGTETHEQAIVYDSLIISTGTTSPSALWSLHRDENLTSDAFKAVQASLPKAKTILIAGGGPVGVETAGEVASAHPAAKVTLLSGGSRLLHRFKPDTGARAQTYLTDKLGVTVVHNVRVEKTFAGQTKTETAQQVPLSDGSTHTADLYIDATGGVPNSEFLPRDWLDETGRVITCDSYFRVRGSGDSDPLAKSVYALGDIVAGSNNTILELDAMIPTVCSSICVDIAARYNLRASAVKAGWFRSLLTFLPGMGSGPTGVLKQKEFKPLKDTVMVPIGPNGGVGQLFGWQSPSWLVKMIKAKTFMIERMDIIITGDK